MIRRTRWALLVLPLLALTAGCSDAIDEFQEWLAPSSQAARMANANPANVSGGAIQSPSVLQETQDTGISLKSTPDQIWADVVIADEEVSIPLLVTTLSDHFYFELPGSSVAMEFIGYQLDEEFCIRASVCPGCGGRHLDFGGGVLSCPDCGNTFDLRSGAAIAGGKGYPEGSIGYFVANGYLKSTLHSLTLAYERTVSGEESLYRSPSLPDPVTGPRCYSCGG